MFHSQRNEQLPLRELVVCRLSCVVYHRIKGTVKTVLEYFASRLLLYASFLVQLVASRAAFIVPLRAVIVAL